MLHNIKPYTSPSTQLLVKLNFFFNSNNHARQQNLTPYSSPIARLTNLPNIRLTPPCPSTTRVKTTSYYHSLFFSNIFYQSSPAIHLFTSLNTKIFFYQIESNINQSMFLLQPKYQSS